MTAAALAGWLWRGSGGSRTVPTFRQVTFRRANISTAAFAPDGKTVAYTVFNGKPPREYFLVSQGSRASHGLWVFPAGSSRSRRLARWRCFKGGKGVRSP